jgi:hypothetical protein
VTRITKKEVAALTPEHQRAGNGQERSTSLGQQERAKGIAPFNRKSFGMSHDLTTLSTMEKLSLRNVAKIAVVLGVGVLIGKAHAFSVERGLQFQSTRCSENNGMCVDQYTMTGGFNFGCPFAMPGGGGSMCYDVLLRARNSRGEFCQELVLDFEDLGRFENDHVYRVRGHELRCALSP